VRRLGTGSSRCIAHATNRAAATLYLSIDARRATADAVGRIVPAVATDVVAAALARIGAITALWDAFLDDRLLLGGAGRSGQPVGGSAPAPD